jgi:hypothetical protein
MPFFEPPTETRQIRVLGRFGSATLETQPGPA